MDSDIRDVILLPKRIFRKFFVKKKFHFFRNTGAVKKMQIFFSEKIAKNAQRDRVEVLNVTARSESTSEIPEIRKSI